MPIQKLSSYLKYIFFIASSTEFHLICIPKVTLQICRRRLTFLLLGDASLCYFHLFPFDLRHICLTFIGTPFTFWILFASSWRNFHHRMRHPNCWSFEIGWGYRHSISPSADGYYALDRSYTPSSVQKGNKTPFHIEQLLRNDQIPFSSAESKTPQRKDSCKQE